MYFALVSGQKDVDKEKKIYWRIIAFSKGKN